MHRSFAIPRLFVPLLFSLCVLLCETGGAFAQQSNAVLKRADDFRKAGQFDRAIAEATEAIKLNGKNAVSYWVRGAAYVGRSDYDQAIADLTRAVTLDPKYAAAYSWRAAFVICGVASFAWVAVWWWYFRDDPREHAGMQEEDLKALPDVKPRLARIQTPWRPLLKRIFPVTLVDFCYGWTLWVYISWMPSFFLHQYNVDLKKAAFLSSAVLFAGVVGDTAGGLLSDAILRWKGDVSLARVSVIVLGFAGCFVFTVPILFTRDLFTVAVCLSAAFFFAELIVAPIWAVPMDIAPEFSGTASGFMNFGFGLAGMISPVVFGAIIDKTGRWDYPFIASLGFLLLGAFLALFMRPDDRFDTTGTKVRAKDGAPA